MSTSAPELPQQRPSVTFDGRDFPMVNEREGWRLRSRSKSHAADFRTGTGNLAEAKRRAKKWLEENAAGVAEARRGGGTLARLAETYIETPKRTKANVAENNVSRLRTVCRLALGKTIEETTCREVNPQLWQAYQKAALEKAGHKFDLVTRYAENVKINACVRAARCLFLPALLRAYRTAGLEVHPEAGQAVMLPIPYLPPTTEKGDELLAAWAALHGADDRLWVTIGLARFAGLRREEIAHCRAGWIEDFQGVAHIALRDRPEEKWWTKTGRPYRAQVIDPDLSAHLLALKAEGPADAFVIQCPPDERARWFERIPQAWLKTQGIVAKKPLHRLRGLYADHIAAITSDAVTARLAAVKAAQTNLGHTSSETTEKHYLTRETQ